VDESKMAKANTTINYDMFKGDHGLPKASHEVKARCSEWCCCDECTCEPSFDEALHPPKDDGLINVPCCTSSK